MNGFEAIVVGSGLAGCRMARDLAAGGLRVAVLEAGPERPAADVGTNDGRPTTATDRRRFAREGQFVQARNQLFTAYNRRFYVDDRLHPYLAHPTFLWFRGRQVGGRSILWSRACVRMSEREFFPQPGGSHWENWPFGYAELAPYYERIERDLAVHGQPSGIDAIPDGAFVATPPSSPRIDGFLSRLRVGDPALRATLARTAALDRGTVPEALREAGRQGVHVFPDSPVRRILVAPGTRRADGVEVVQPDGTSRVVRCRVVVLCASTIETVRILWQSHGATHPRGMGNHADRLGRGVQDHLAVNCAGRLAADLRALPHRPFADPLDPWREEPPHCLVSGREPPSPPSLSASGSSPTDCLASCSFAPDGGSWSLLVLGASRALPEHRITVERLPGAAPGETVPRVTLARTADDEDRLVSLGRFAKRIARVGGLGPFGLTPAQRFMHLVTPRWALARCGRVPGAVIHETGGARMGTDPGDSVVDPWGRCWDADNVFVADGSVFPSSGFQNPTLTILAVAARTAEHVLRTRGNWDVSRGDHQP